MPELRVMLVDDHAVLRAGLHLLINGQSDMTVVAEASGAQEAVRLAGQCPVDMIVMDLSLTEGDGISATEQILQRHPQVQVVGLTWHKDRGYLTRMLQAGARGYVLKQSAADGLLVAIRTVAAGGTYIDPSFTRAERARTAEHGDLAAREAALAPENSTSELTADEVAVLQRVAWSYSNREIAEQLGMPRATVAEHKARAMRKLGLQTRIDVLHYAEAHGWKREAAGGV